MANLIVRHDPGRYVEKDWDPARWFREILRFDPFREMAPYVPNEERVWAPAFEVKETKDGYEFRADLPGVKDKDLEITLTGNRLVIAGKREAEKHEQADNFFTYERAYGMFTRAFTLPEGIDMAHVRAELKEGVLTLVLPKLPEMQPKKILVAPIDRPKS